MVAKNEWEVKRILFTGDRNWSDREVVEMILEWYKVGDPLPTIIVGGARGADTEVEDVAREMGFPVEVYPAQWGGKEGKGAGPKRNQQMIDTEPDLVIALHDDLSKSKGTKDCVTRARKAGIPVVVFTSFEESVDRLEEFMKGVDRTMAKERAENLKKALDRSGEDVQS